MAGYDFPLDFAARNRASVYNAVGKPMDQKWLKAHATIYHSLVGTAYRDDTEYIEYVQRIHSLRTKYGFMPKEE